MKAKLYILAGANGSGKSTISRVLLPAESLVYVNPDDIARELNASDPTAAKVEAGKATLRRIDKLLAARISFAIESTLSGNLYLKVLAKAKELGYETAILYTFVDSPDVCIARIAARVKAGGHHVPDEDVRRRYYRSKKNFIEVYSKAVDLWTLSYNGEVPRIIAEGRLGEEPRIYSSELYALFKKEVS